MKLLRFNSIPIEIDPAEIVLIDAGNGVFTVHLETGEHLMGYVLRKE